MDDRITTYKYTKEERDQLRALGEFLTEEGVFGLKTAKRGVNISAVIRYLISREVKRMNKTKSQTVTEGDE